MHRRGLPAALAAQRDSLHAADTSSARQCREAMGPRCPELGYGLGWSVFAYPTHRVLGHTGADWGEKAMAFYSPERRDGLVLLTNGANGVPVMLDAGMLLCQDARLVEFFAAWRQALAQAPARAAGRTGTAP
jgi:CubicO group peptidase (beta-lactamase class C family)